MGLHRVIPHLRTVAYVEIEAFAIANLVCKIETGKMDAAPIWTDIKTFPGQRFSGKVHGILAGYPCQPFSNAGKRGGVKDPRHLWPYIEKHIRTIRPLWCFFENVGGHLTLGFEEVAQSLRGMGYKVEAGLFTAAEVGAPHKRERLFILAKMDNSMLGRYGSSEKEVCAGRDNGEPGGQGRPLQIEGSGDMAISDSQHGRSHAGGRDDNTETRSAGETELDIANSDRFSGHETRTKTQQDHNKQENGLSGETSKYPARPGQQQYDWEEPRTVKSGMGRAVDGFASRVDELRLLGNGVVPQTAELAFRTL